MTDKAAQPPDLHAWDAIVRHYERCLEQHGRTPKGVDWPNGVDLATRFSVMLTLLDQAGERPSLLDLGCGPGLLLDYLTATGNVDRVRYHGIDLSRAMVDAARARWPDQDFSCRDIIAAPLAPSGPTTASTNTLASFGAGRCARRRRFHRTGGRSDRPRASRHEIARSRILCQPECRRSRLPRNALAACAIS